VKHEKVKIKINEYLMTMRKKETHKEVNTWLRKIGFTALRPNYFRKILEELKVDGVKNTDLIVTAKRSGNFKLREGVKAQSRI
jgi:hypothetical protein